MSTTIIKKRWKKYIPYLDLGLKIPFIKIHTQVMFEGVCTDTFEYLLLYVEIHKWHFKFRLYNIRKY